MIAGATRVGLQLIATAFGLPWKLQFLCMLTMGWGFYMIHGCLQVFASELSVEARATALSLHSFFFFMGQTVGPIAYGFGLQHGGKAATLVTAAACMIVLGLVCAGLPRQRLPADAVRRPDAQPYAMFAPGPPARPSHNSRARTAGNPLRGFACRP